MSMLTKRFFGFPWLLVFLWLVAPASATYADSPSQHQGADAPRSPSSLDRERLGRIDKVVEQAIEHGDMPGAVVLVVHRGQVVFRKAYGSRSKQPAETPMTPDTVFDLASLTKPVATATSLLILVEQGKLRFSDRVAQYLPAFGQNGKKRINVEQLLLH